jgi:hypothetical protein
MGRSMKIGFFCHIMAVRPAWGCTSTVSRRAVRLVSTSTLTSFRENLIFSPLFAYSPTPKANKGFLGPFNTDRKPLCKVTTLSLTKC